MENFTQEHINKYIEYVCIYRVKSGFKAISEIEEINKSEEEIRKLYHSNGGIQKWLADELNLTLEELGNLESNDKVIFEKEKIDYIYDKYSQKQSSSKNNDFHFINFFEFYNWYIEMTRNGNICCYCGVNQDELNKIENDNPLNRLKRNKRGKTLEIERIISYPKDKNIYSKDNCDFACHICNNAKSDFLSPSEFKSIAKGINQMWKTKGIDFSFPENSKIWNINY